MTHVPRPLLGVLVATIVFFALWIVALKPSSSTTGASSGLGQYQSAINQAKASAASQDRAAAAANNTTAGGASGQSAASGGAPAAAKPGAAAKPAAAATAAKPAAHAKSTAAAAKPATAAKPTTRTHAATSTETSSHAKPVAASRPATPIQRLNVVDRALADHKVLAILFYNPAASDDQAVKQELQTVPTSGGRVVKLAIPLTEVANYPVVTNQVLIQSSPTLVIIDSSRQAFTLVGFSSAFEIAHRVGDALSMH
jgi:hypothetical protein